MAKLRILSTAEAKFRGSFLKKLSKNKIICLLTEYIYNVIINLINFFYHQEITMDKFEQFFNDVCNLSIEEKIAGIGGKLDNVVAAITSFCEGDQVLARKLIAQYALAAAGVDDKIDKEELKAVMPFMRTMFTDDFSFEDLESLAKSFWASKQETIELLDNVIDCLDRQDKSDLLFIVACICGFNGTFTAEEKQFFKKLMD